jgi:hypothetical protein
MATVACDQLLLLFKDLLNEALMLSTQTVAITCILPFKILQGWHCIIKLHELIVDASRCGRTSLS